MLTTLLDKTTAPLNRLALHRIQLDASSPSVTLGHVTRCECLLYSLCGKASVFADGQSLTMIGGRRSVTDRLIHAVRFPAGKTCTVTVSVADYAADLLWVTCYQLNAVTRHEPSTPYIHYSDATVHQVGEGTHRREVRVLELPPGYEIEAGETLNISGGLSSWPAHANGEDIARFLKGEVAWEELMFFVCSTPGIAVLDGYYNPTTHGSQHTREVYRVENGSARVMPLGSHTLYAAPDSPLWYFWVYCGNALQKQYRKWATDVGTYRK